MNTGVIVAARTGSSRLPGKVLMPLLGQPLVLFMLRRLATSRLAESIVLATTSLEQDNELAAVVEQAGFAVYRGSESDVLQRYVGAACGRGWDYAVRATADCPLIDGTVLDGVLQQCAALQPFDLATTKPAFPRGIDFEVYSVPLLEAIDGYSDVSESDREHIMNYIYRHEERYRVCRLAPPPALHFDTEFLIDTADDYSRMTALLDGETSIYIPAYDVAAKEARTARLL